jgi:hypothetical protein
MEQDSCNWPGKGEFRMHLHNVSSSHSQPSIAGYALVTDSYWLWTWARHSYTYPFSVEQRETQCRGVCTCIPACIIVFIQGTLTWPLCCFCLLSHFLAAWSPIIQVINFVSQRQKSMKSLVLTNSEGQHLIIISLNLHGSICLISWLFWSRFLGRWRWLSASIWET